MNKPLVAIFANYMAPENSAFSFDRVFTNSAYVDSLASGGCLVSLVPFFESQMLSSFDGFVFQGGADVDPSLYGAERHPLCQKSDIIRDKRDIEAVLAAQKAGLPILGICRGIQAINVALGGSLWQDTSLCPGTYKHSNYGTPTKGVHEVTIEKDSHLFEIFKTDRLFVNSLHHQSVKDVAPGLKVTARATDGTIEGLESQDGKILAVQWHPEAMFAGGDNSMLPLFTHFARVASK